MLECGWPADGGNHRQGGKHAAALGRMASESRKWPSCWCDNGAPLDVPRPLVFDGVPLGWAVHGSLYGPCRDRDYGAVAEVLLAAGRHPARAKPAGSASVRASLREIQEVAKRTTPNSAAIVCMIQPWKTITRILEITAVLIVLTLVGALAGVAAQDTPKADAKGRRQEGRREKKARAFSAEDHPQGRVHDRRSDPGLSLDVRARWPDDCLRTIRRSLYSSHRRW